ncbi:RNA polymerase sigma factor SigF [Streptomyces albidus (ex Kaewkla and Franco 2022)]|uniref:RNA polymerase sigma factor SigF n=1 Tax=Streptomyces albidus (ex Kaewkla and Franco 2022) TaxID=722709 RepID=UPI0015EEEF1B|nr:RNA polymerase sigma factor SigF [Streptomyces albidus (ex Kaewkla and Franco 2022)]
MNSATPTVVTAVSATTTASVPGGRAADGTSDQLPSVDATENLAPADARQLSKTLFDRLTVLEEGTHEYQYVRNTLIEINLTLVRFSARRFRSRGDDMEDIVQVGTIGLIKAIDRFDLSREVEFTTFAIPYVVGEIKRFFRDTTWDVRVPRRLQEMRMDLARANDKLTSKLGRSPRVSELAEHLDVSEEEIIEGQVAANGYNSSSLDATVNDEEGEASLADVLGECDEAMDLVEDFHTLKPLLAELSERDRKIIELRFGEELTQAQIGEQLGLSQMHVSRLLSRSLSGLRKGMLANG